MVICLHQNAFYICNISYIVSLIYKSIIVLFAKIKMIVDNLQPKTPSKQSNHNEQEMNNQIGTNSRQKIPPITVHFKENDRNNIERLQKIEKLQNDNAKSKLQQTTKKISVVSSLPQPKTEKKRYLTLMQMIKQQKREEQESECFSIIASEQHNNPIEILQDQQIRTSMNYFTEEMLLLVDQIQNDEHNQMEIQYQEKIAILSQVNSVNQLKRSKENQKEGKEELNASQKMRKKISLCSIKRQQKIKRDLTQQIQIKAIFRYCIGCQYPILQANIKIHQQKCADYQRIYQLNYQQIAQLLRQMITELGSKIDHIKEALTEQDLRNLKIYTDALIQESELISATGQESQIYQFKLESLKEVSNKWVLFAEQICKLNWFIKLRQLVTKKYYK